MRFAIMPAALIFLWTRMIGDDRLTSFRNPSDQLVSGVNQRGAIRLGGGQMVKVRVVCVLVAAMMLTATATAQAGHYGAGKVS